MAKRKLNPIIRVIPILYDSLPKPSKFLTSCKKIVDLINQDELFKHYRVEAVFADDLIPYCRYITKAHIPPRNLRYNSNDGWLTADHFRWNLELLHSNDPVEEGSSLRYPGVDKGDILLAVVPASVETTPEIWATESHFGTSAWWHGSPLKVMRFIYHVRLHNSVGDTIESFFLDFDEGRAANDIVEHIAAEHMGIKDPQMEMIRIQFGYDLRKTQKHSDLYERLRVFFYGNDICAPLILKRAVLLFDDIHFHDSPGFNIGNWGLIGSDSRVRSYVYAFAKEGVPLLVHKPIAPWLSSNLENLIAAELEDPLFSEIFFDGFKTDRSFRSLFIQNEGDYVSKSRVNKGRVIADAMTKLDLGGKAYDLSEYKNAVGNEFNPSDEEGLRRTFAQFLIHASVKLSICCAIGYEHDVIPFTEFPTLEKLVARRYERAIKEGNIPKNAVDNKLIYISFKLFDAIIPNDVLERSSFADVIKYRQETRNIYQEFRKYLMKLNSEVESKPWDEPFEEEVKKIIRQEVIPEANRFENECKQIWEKMFGGIAKRVIEGGAVGFALSCYTGFSWLDVLLKGCGIGGTLTLPSLIDAALEFRNLRRTNSLSYLIDLKSKIS